MSPSRHMQNCVNRFIILGPGGHDSDSLRLRSRTAQRRIRDQRAASEITTIHQPGFVELDSESPVFCHNDLSSYNVGWLGDRLLAIDWEYAAMGSPHYDVASASEGMKHNERHEFAMRVLEDTFDKNLWSTACRVVPLINYLWALATEDHDTAYHFDPSLKSIT